MPTQWQGAPSRVSRQPSFFLREIAGADAELSAQKDKTGMVRRRLNSNNNIASQSTGSRSSTQQARGSMATTATGKAQESMTAESRDTNSNTADYLQPKNLLDGRFHGHIVNLHSNSSENCGRSQRDFVSSPRSAGSSFSPRKQQPKRTEL